MSREPEENTYFLCRRSSAAAEIITKAEAERDRLLEELRAFYTGDIGVKIYEIQHVMGSSIAGDLTVNGGVCRTYDPVDLCFLDLNTLMMKRLLAANLKGGAA